jgi:NADH-quinone oxidoreductase subunit M
MLVPMYFIIGSFGGPRRQYAAMKFFLYSLVGGLLMLASVIGLYITTGSRTFAIADLIGQVPDNATQKWLFLGFFIAFAIKAPLVPFHTWLPDAGAEAPIGGAALLVGVLDKVGTFGFLRYCLPLFPDASTYFAPTVLVLSVIGILYAAFLAIGQRDMKRLVAYTSVAHFGFIGLGIFAFTTQGGSGAVLYMVNHGLSTGALFIVVGLLIARGKSRSVDDYGGAAKVTPILAGLFLLAGLSALALPGMSTFVSEFLVLVGTFTRHKGLAVLATTGIVLAAIYVLYLYKRTFQGTVSEKVQRFRDVNVREMLAVGPLIALIIFLGFYPKPALDVINPAVQATLHDVHKTDPVPKYGPVAEESR